MNDFDLDRLGDVWRQQPDPEEMKRLQDSATKVARRAKLAQVIDIVAAIAVAAIVVALVAANPKADTLLLGAGAIIFLLGSNVRLRKLRRVELSSLTGSTEDMLDQAILRAETTSRHHRFGLFAIGPAFVIGVVVAAESRGGQMLPALLGGSKLGLTSLGLGMAVVIATFFYSLRGLRRARRELDRLRAMREAYRHERESTTS